MNSYFPEDIQKYLYSTLKSSTFHIWQGAGGNGRTSLAKFVSTAISAVYNIHFKFITTHELLHNPINSYHKTKLIIIDDYDTDKPVPAARVKQFTDSGFTIILICNTYPIIQGEAESIWGLTHVIPFKNRLPHTDISYALYNQIRNHLLCEIQEYNYLHIDLPNVMCQALEQVKLLALQSRTNGVSPQPIIERESNLKDTIKTEYVSAESKHWPGLMMPKAPCLVVTEETMPNIVEAVYLPVKITLCSSLLSENATLLIDADPDSDDYIVTYVKEYCRSKLRIYSLAELNKYIGAFFATLQYSETVYDTYKFNVPCFPNAVVPHTKVVDYVQTNFLAQLELLSESWPNA
jgi:hypothetical protein